MNLETPFRTRPSGPMSMPAGGSQAAPATFSRPLKHVLVIHAAENVRQRLGAALLEGDDIDVFEAIEPEEGLRRALSEPFDLVIIGSILPSPGPVALLRALRSQGVLCPLLVLLDGEGAAQDMVTVRAFDAGANDVFPGRCSDAALLARIRAHLRHAEGSEGATLMIGPYQLVPLKKTLTASDGARVRLTGKEVEILRQLHRARGTTVERQALLVEIWGYNAKVNTHTLETHIYRLRRKMETDPTEPRLILTERGGYRLVTQGEAFRVG
ncbi:MAG: response regulator transcription factor [Pseudomonadota bacterium]